MSSFDVTKVSSLNTVAAKKYGSCERTFEDLKIDHLPFRSLAYATPFPSGMNFTKRSCSGVLVMRLVNEPSKEVTKTSPLLIKAISLPFGAISIS